MSFSECLKLFVSKFPCIWKFSIIVKSIRMSKSPFPLSFIFSSSFYLCGCVFFQLEASMHQISEQQMPSFNLPSKILCKVVNVQLRVGDIMLIFIFHGGSSFCLVWASTGPNFILVVIWLVLKLECRLNPTPMKFMRKLLCYQKLMWVISPSK